MTRSLQGHLSKMLALAIVCCGIAASVASSYFAYSDAQELQDDTLRQVAAMSAGARAEMRRLDAAGGRVEDPEARIRLYRLPDGPLPAWLPADLAPGFHTLSVSGNGGRMRAFVRDVAPDGRLVAAQSTDSRDEIALNSALRTLVPLALLLPLLLAWMAHIVRRELAPLRRLSQELDRQQAAALEPLPRSELPAEVAPFVEAIERLLGRVDRLVTEQRRFVADAAHELRTPLAALSLQAQNLAHAASPEELRERVVPLQAGIERARKMTVQLLDLAKVQAGPSRPARVDVPALARELLAEFLPVAEGSGIDLGMSEGAALSVDADPEALRLILRNALENALRHTPSGGEVTIALRAEGPAAVIEVVDGGPGIPPDERERVFEPFYRSRNAIGEGSGLGLAIAREAAAEIGGHIVLRDRPDGPGLVFSYRQPLAPSQPSR